MQFHHHVPQPSPQRMVPIPGSPLVVGVVPGQSELVTATAAAWADALGGVPLHFAYVDATRIVDEEYRRRLRPALLTRPGPGRRLLDERSRTSCART